MSDDSASIDFVLWNAQAQKLDEKIQQGSSYNIYSVKFKPSRKGYAKTDHPYQLIFSNATVLERLDIRPMTAPLKTTEIIKLKETAISGSKANIIGKITQNNPTTEEDVNGKAVCKKQVKVTDHTGSVDITFWGRECNDVNCSIGDFILIENALVKQYGAYTCLSMSPARYTINPTHITQCLREKIDESDQVPDISPRKITVKLTTENANTVNDGQLVSFKGTVKAIKHAVYDRCSSRNCRKAMYKRGDIYACDKCETDYIAAAAGIRLTVTLRDEFNVDRDIVIFNEKAMSFLGIQTIDNNNLNDTLLNGQIGQFFHFTVSKREQDFLCVKFEAAHKSRDRDEEGFASNVRRHLFMPDVPGEEPPKKRGFFMDDLLK